MPFLFRMQYFVTVLHNTCFISDSLSIGSRLLNYMALLSSLKLGHDKSSKDAIKRCLTKNPG